MNTKTRRIVFAATCLVAASVLVSWALPHFLNSAAAQRDLERDSPPRWEYGQLYRLTGSEEKAVWYQSDLTVNSQSWIGLYGSLLSRLGDKEKRPKEHLESVENHRVAIMNFLRSHDWELTDHTIVAISPQQVEHWYTFHRLRK